MWPVANLQGCFLKLVSLITIFIICVYFMKFICHNGFFDQEVIGTFWEELPTGEFPRNYTSVRAFFWAFTLPRGTLWSDIINVHLHHSELLWYWKCTFSEVETNNVPQNRILWTMIIHSSYKVNTINWGVLRTMVCELWKYSSRPKIPSVIFSRLSCFTVISTCKWHLHCVYMVNT